MKKRRRLKPKVKFYIIELIFIVLIIYSLTNICIWWVSNKKNSKILDDIAKDIIVNDDSKNLEDKYDINFDDLKKRNPDIVAWIKVNGTNIAYPVVKSSDNDYYLTHNFNKSYNKAGWIFANYQNKLDGSDKNITLFGHGRRDGSMFGSLRSVINEKWQNNSDNLSIIFITENETSLYKVFSTYRIAAEDYYIRSNFTDEEFSDFVKTIKSRSNKDYNVEVTSDDKILTLSTCDVNSDYRIVLHAKKI